MLVRSSIAIIVASVTVSVITPAVLAAGMINEVTIDAPQLAVFRTDLAHAVTSTAFIGAAVQSSSTPSHVTSGVPTVGARVYPPF